MEFRPIGFVESIYSDTTYTPKRAGLVPSVTSIIKMVPPYNKPAMFVGLEDTSHIWVTFVFHLNKNKVEDTISLPRSPGLSLGVFATRVPNRPNPIGISPVKLEKVAHNNNTVELHVSGADFLNGTPVIDIKPYIEPDCIPNAKSATIPVSNNKKVVDVKFSVDIPADLKLTVIELLKTHPYFMYASTDADKVHQLDLYNIKILWKFNLESGLVEIVDYCKI